MNGLKDFLVVMLGCVLPFFGIAQPACVSDGCCCGSPIEVGVPCGDFEAPPFANPIIVYFPGEMFCDWTVYSGSIDVLGPNYSNWASGNPNGASQFIDLHGNTPGSFGTTLTGLTVGYSYTLVFWYAKNAGASSANCQVQVANGAWLDESFTATNNGADGWLEKCYSFIAQATTANLSFTGSGPVTAGGVLLDDITLWGCPVDEEPPTIGFIPVSPLTLECDDPIPAPDDLQVTDDCSAQIVTEFEEDMDVQACNTTITRSWIFTDECGNSSTAEQVINIEDTQPPVFDILPSDFIANCGEDNIAQFHEWILANGGGVGVDNCDPDVEWDVDYFSEPDGGCGTISVNFAIYDECANANAVSASFIVQDNTPPTLLELAEDITVYCSPDPEGEINTWLDNWGGASAEDDCGPLIWSHDFNGDYTQEEIPILFTVMDGCGNQVATSAVFYQVSSSDTLLQTGWTCDPFLTGSDTTIVTNEGCETVTITTITQAPSDTLYFSATTCDPLLAGSDTLFLLNQFDCDSLRITTTTLSPTDQITLVAGSCDPSQVGADTLIFQNQYGCDSLVITQTDLLPSSVKNLQLSTCDPAAAGLDTLHLTNQYGCDSTVYVTTSYTGVYQESNTSLVCGAGANYLDTLVVTSGPCDSLFITQYIHSPLDTTWLTGTTCQAGQSGIFIQVMPDQSGCDSTIITTISLLQGDTTFISDVTCIKAEAQSDTLALINQNGCDSTVIISIAYVGVDTQYIQASTCDPAQVGVVTHTLSGMYCDTIRVTETIWVPFAESRDTITLCTATGPVSDTLVLVGQSGCDSLVIYTYHYTDLQVELALINETCAGDTDGEIQVLATAGGQSPYSYRLAGGLWQPSGAFAGLPPGTYTLEVRDANNCLLQAGGQVIEAGSILILDAGPDRSQKTGDLINLNVEATSPLAEVQWIATDPLGCATCVQSALGPLTVSQTVVITGISMDGCPGQDELTVTVEERLHIYIPNSFSPNGDGINDLFSLYSSEEGLIVRNLDIFDRWGNALYHQEALPVNDPTQGWDGQWRSKQMDPGVYVYVIELEHLDGSRQILKGDVTILR